MIPMFYLKHFFLGLFRFWLHIITSIIHIILQCTFSADKRPTETVPVCPIPALDARNHGTQHRMANNYNHLPLTAMVFQDQFCGNDELLRAQEHRRQYKVAS
jgi:hypothetical protein